MSNGTTVVSLTNIAASNATVTLTSVSNMTYVFFYDQSVVNQTQTFIKSNAAAASKSVMFAKNITVFAYNINGNGTGQFVLSYTLGAFATYSVSIISMIAGVVFYAATL